MNLPELVHLRYGAKRSYIELGFAIIAAANEQNDSTPIKGSGPEALDELLDLKKKGLKSTVILALGHRNPEADWVVNLKK